MRGAPKGVNSACCEDCWCSGQSGANASLPCFSLMSPQIPVLLLEGMSEADRKAYVIAVNRLAELAGWDRELLARSWAICQRWCQTSTLTPSALKSRRLKRC